LLPGDGPPTPRRVCDDPSLNLASPGELVAAIPFLLAFHPRRSVALMALQQRRLNLTQRLDLPDPGHELEAARAMIRPLLRQQPDSALVIGYEDDPGQSRPIIDRLSALLAENRIPVIDRIVVYDGRWRSLDCADPDCCPRQGTQVLEPADVPHIAAEFVGAGVAPLPRRGDLQDSVEAHASATSVRAIIDRMDAGSEKAGTLQQPREAVADSWARVLDPRPDAPPLYPSDAAVTGTGVWPCRNQVLGEHDATTRSRTSPAWSRTLWWKVTRSPPVHKRGQERASARRPGTHVLPQGFPVEGRPFVANVGAAAGPCGKAAQGSCRDLPVIRTRN
jgi:hypothetical protein